MSDILILIQVFSLLAVVGGYWHLSKSTQQIAKLALDCAASAQRLIDINAKIESELAYARKQLDFVLEEGKSLDN